MMINNMTKVPTPGPANPALKVPGIPADAKGGSIYGQRPTPQAAPTVPKPPDASPWQAPQGMSPTAAVTPVAPPPPIATPGAAIAPIQSGSNNDLRFSAITPGPQADRFEIAKTKLNDFKSLLNPDYAEANRGITQRAAALGRVGNQDNINDFGGGVGFKNLDKSYADRIGTYASGILNDALEGSIQDQANNRNELRGERTYQEGLDQSAYDRARQGVFDTDALTNSAFGRAQAQNAAGQAGNPAQFLGLLGQNAQQQADQSGTSTAEFIKNLILGGGNPTPSVPQVTQNGKPISIADMIRTTA